MSVEEDLQKVITQMKLFASAEFKAEILEELGKAGLVLIDEEFAKEKDPFGQAWALLKKSRPGGGILNKTGKMKDSFGFDVGKDNVRFFNPTEYASYHQDGTDIMPERAMLPHDTAPEEWLEKFKEIIEKKVKDILK